MANWGCVAPDGEVSVQVLPVGPGLPVRAYVCVAAVRTLRAEPQTAAPAPPWSLKPVVCLWLLLRICR